MVMPLVYVTAVHLPILSEARQSLPVKPLAAHPGGHRSARMRSAVAHFPANRRFMNASI